ncbi:RIP metalloprotease RseP [Blattabacterium cuenoti]|uniref:RIP metalloprotease RseP n=1 Tax=Blattabacterium cuenoti TaxID=1653831 RepID=UPI00163CE057|nr:RIP metalloprotease RseP [Blattabacterium cuenoti]
MFLRPLQLIISISLLILVHELGHFVFSKLFGVRVEKFFLFFNPFFSIFKKKIGDTLYGIGWIPLGGYIKISGIRNTNNYIDNHNFYSKSLIKRLLIISGGIIANFVLSIFIFSFFLFKNGDSKLLNKNILYGIEINDLLDQFGLKNGDKILSIDHNKIPYFNEINKHILLGNKIILNRNNKIINLSLSDKKKFFFDKKKINFIVIPRTPPIINFIISNSYAEKYGLKSNDEILSINYIPIMFQDQLKYKIKRFNINNKKIIIGINRNGKFLQKKFFFKKKNILGLSFKNFIELYNIFNIKVNNYSIMESLLNGLKKSEDVFKDQIFFLKNIFQIETKAYKHLGSFLSIAQEFPNYWNWSIFLNLTAYLSIWLAFLNLIPIPSLDGGYIFFIILELIIGKKLSEKISEIFNVFGFIIISLIMIIIMIWDIFKFFHF